MSPVVLLLALAAAPSSKAGPPSPARTATTAAVPRAVVFSTYVRPSRVLPDAGLGTRQAAAFSARLNRAAKTFLRFRRWTFIPAPEAAGACTDDPCLVRLARRASATHALVSSLGSAESGACTASATLYDLAERAVDREVFRTIEPCSDDALLVAAEGIGREVARGPRAKPRVAINLTPRALPDLGIPDLPDIAAPLSSRTSSAASRPVERREALEQYRTEHMFTFSGDQGGLYIARDDRLLTECEARRAADVERPEPVLAHCRGNSWEWAWLGAPIGSLIFLGSYGDVGSGDFGNVVGVSLGTLIIAVSGGLAVALNEDAARPEDGRPYSSHRTIRRIVGDHNARLRRKLGLSDAEVLVAGMRLH